MKLTINTETDSLEDLQQALSIITNTLEKKGAKTQKSVKELHDKPNMENPFVKRAIEQEKLMKTIDISSILQSDFGLKKKREESLHKKFK